MLMVGGDPTWWRRREESLEQGSGLVKQEIGITAQGEGWLLLAALNCPTVAEKAWDGQSCR